MSSCQRSLSFGAAPERRVRARAQPPAAATAANAPPDPQAIAGQTKSAPVPAAPADGDGLGAIDNTAISPGSVGGGSTQVFSESDEESDGASNTLVCRTMGGSTAR